MKGKGELTGFGDDANWPAPLKDAELNSHPNVFN